ncbi:MAG: DinB family protein [Gemmatimonadota bacterium]|nr:DinB family protein [Gemmatimonadota bacterium]
MTEPEKTEPERTEQLREVWLRGPIDGIPGQLQPVAHALEQAREELRGLLPELSMELLRTRPGGVASAGFHLRHMAGVLNRLCSYARGEMLSEEQFRFLAEEKNGPAGSEASPAELVSAFEWQVDQTIAQLRATDDQTLDELRYVGRQRIPSTVRGLLFHAAEHTQRHLGQLLVTVRVQR